MGRGPAVGTAAVAEPGGQSPSAVEALAASEAGSGGGAVIADGFPRSSWKLHTKITLHEHTAAGPVCKRQEGAGRRGVVPRIAGCRRVP